MTKFIYRHLAGIAAAVLLGGFCAVTLPADTGTTDTAPKSNAAELWLQITNTSDAKIQRELLFNLLQIEPDNEAAWQLLFDLYCHNPAYQHDISEAVFALGYRHVDNLNLAARVAQYNWLPVWRRGNEYREYLTNVLLAQLPLDRQNWNRNTWHNFNWFFTQVINGALTPDALAKLEPLIEQILQPKAGDFATDLRLLDYYAHVKRFGDTSHGFFGWSQSDSEKAAAKVAALWANLTLNPDQTIQIDTVVKLGKRNLEYAPALKVLKLKTAPTTSDYALQLNLLSLLGQWDAGVELLQKLAASNQLDAATVQAGVDFYLASGQINTAKTFLFEQLAKKPKWHDELYFPAMELAGDTDDKVKMAGLHLSDKAMDWAIKAADLQRLLYSKDWAAAKSYLSTNKAGLHSELYYSLGLQIALGAGDRELLWQLYTEADEQGQLFFPIIANNFGYTMAEFNDGLGEAERLLKTALAVEPENPVFLDSLAFIYLRTGKLKLAQKYIELALKQDFPRAEQWTIIEHAGDIALTNKEYKKAVGYYLQLLNAPKWRDFAPARILLKLQMLKVPLPQKPAQSTAPPTQL